MKRKHKHITYKIDPDTDGLIKEIERWRFRYGAIESVSNYNKAIYYKDLLIKAEEIKRLQKKIDNLSNENIKLKNPIVSGLDRYEV